MPSRFTIPVPRDYVLRRDLCSYGYFLLWPNHWNVTEHILTRVLELKSGPVVLRAQQMSEGRAGAPLRVLTSRTLDAGERKQAIALLSRMLRLDEDRREIAEFHTLDPRWKSSGRGRLMRSPTFFEDVIKTVTSCNVQWPSTIVMNRRLCEVVGKRAAAAGPVTHSFPTPTRLSRTRVTTLRSRCRTGYRDQRIIDLARLFARGEINPAWFEDPTTPGDAIHAALLELPGIGPYAAANIMQLLGRYDRLPLDSESVRHGKMVLGMTGTDAQIMRAIHQHFTPFGRHAFRSYWFELWDFYEQKRGPSWTWERDTTGTTFTAAQLQAKAAPVITIRATTPTRRRPRVTPP